jgi:hypothetical protein
MVAFGSGAATAAPAPLADAELDQVVAGAVGDVGQLQRALIETIVLPRLLALQQQLGASGSEVSVDISALLELLGYQAAPAARTLGAATARTANAVTPPVVRSLRLLDSGASVNILGLGEGGVEVFDIVINETPNSASASVSVQFLSNAQPGATVRSSGVGATATAGN